MSELRFTLAIIAATLFSAAHAGAQVAESEINALNSKWITAEVNHDTGTLERVLDERFLATLVSGKTIDRSARKTVTVHETHYFRFLCPVQRRVNSRPAFPYGMRTVCSKKRVTQKFALR